MTGLNDRLIDYRQPMTPVEKERYTIDWCYIGLRCECGVEIGISDAEALYQCDCGRIYKTNIFLAVGNVPDTNSKNKG